MSIAAIGLNLLLAVLLVAALVMGARVEKRLKALKASHDGFARAVADLDAAAARAEQGLADLRAATDEAAETLAERIAKAKQLAMKLDERIDAGAKALEAAERHAAAPARRPVADLAPREPAFREPLTRETPDSVARIERFRRTLEEPRQAAHNSPALRLRERLAAEDLSPLKLTERAYEAVRSKARVDDDLFDEPLRMGAR